MLPYFLTYNPSLYYFFGILFFYLLSGASNVLPTWGRSCAPFSPRHPWWCDVWCPAVTLCRVLSWIRSYLGWISYLGHRTGCCIAASWQGGVSTCSDVPAWPFQSGGARSSLGGTGSRVGRRWWCTASTGRHASGEHRPLSSSSSGSWACQWKHTLKKKRGGPICFKVYQQPLTCSRMVSTSGLHRTSYQGLWWC